MENDVEERSKLHFLLASGGYETQIRIFDQDARVVRALQFPDVQVLQIAFSGGRSARPDERLLLAVGGSPKIGVYDISPESVSPSPFYMYDMHTGPITSVGFEPKASEFLYSSSEDGTLQVWVPVAQHHSPQNESHQSRRPSRNTLRTFFNRGPSTSLVPINDAVLHTHEMLYFTVDALGRLRVWDHNQKKGEGLLREHIPHKSRRRLQCIDMSVDCSMVVMANLDGMVFIYRVSDVLRRDVKAVPAVIRPTKDYVTRVRLSHSMNLLSCPLTNGIKVFRMRDITMKQAIPVEREDDLTKIPVSEIQTIAPVQFFVDRVGWIWDAPFVGDSDEYVISCSSNTTVRLWDLKNFSNCTPFPPSRKAVVCLAVKQIIMDYPPEQGVRESEAATISSSNNRHVELNGAAGSSQYGGGHDAAGNLAMPA